MKKINILLCSIIFTLLFFSVFSLQNIHKVNALSSGEVVNNVIYVTFEDGNDTWQNEVPNYYSNDIKTIMDNSYNNSSSSVNSYYKTMSFNSLNLTSNFYFSNSNNSKCFKVPYTKNQLIPYSKLNPSGYLEYDVCTYTASQEPMWLTPDFLTSATHRFSCYECENSAHNGLGYNCDLDTSDGIGCYCAYVKFANANPKTALYTHLEEYIREQIALKSVLNKISTFSGKIDSDNDGYIDSMTFIFPHADGVDWGDLLWAHQFEIINFSEYLPPIMSSPQTVQLLITNHGVRNENIENINILLNEVKISNKACKSYNLYLFSDIVKQNYQVLKGADNKEIGMVFTLAHELGHVLGLPDYYTYVEETGEEDPVGIWDLMSYANYSAPTYMTTYNREILGFTNSKNIVKIEYNGTYTLKPTCYDEINNNSNNSNNVLAYVLEDPNYSGQKIYLEYRYKGGKFEPNYQNKENGLLVYRVDNNITQAPEFSNLLSAGNFYGNPFNLYVFRDGENFVLNDDYNTFGNSNIYSTNKAITFQTYDKSQNQYELGKNDITFHNSGIILENVSINTHTNELTFSISGGYLKNANDVDLRTIKLNGTNIVMHEVNTTYQDSGINFANFNESDFTISKNDNLNINNIGTYNITYTITHKASSKQIVLTRTIKVVDTTKPVVTLIGNAIITLKDINDYIENGVNYTDNYNSKSDLELTISKPVLNSSTGEYIVTYKVKDKSNNETTIYRTIKIKTSNTDFSSVVLNGEENITHEVKTFYQDAGINFGIFNEHEFRVDKITSLNINQLGNYNYIYNLTYISTGETFSLIRRISVVDTTAPIINLFGDSIIEMYKSQLENFVDPGYSFLDNYDLNLFTNISLNKISDEEYVIVYYAKDSSGNETTVERTIRLIAKPLDKIENQFSIEVKDDTPISLNKEIVFEVNYILLDDNLVDEYNKPQITFFVNEEEVTTGINGNSITLIFTEEGIYNIKAVVGDTEIIKQLVVSDDYNKKERDKITATIVFVVLCLIILIWLISFIKLKSSAKKIKKRTDRY